jgi:hypothetical protein
MHTKLSMQRRAMIVLWPAFLMAGVLEALVFVVVDPLDFHWFGGPALGRSAMAVYTVTFLIFWAVMSMAGALTTWLWLDAADVNRPATHGMQRPRR